MIAIWSRQIPIFNVWSHGGSHPIVPPLPTLLPKCSRRISARNWGKIKIPVLVLGAWKSYEQYTDHKRTETNLRSQYAKLRGVKIAINDTSRHFIMWDDPQWMFTQIDSFLGTR